MPYLPTFRRKWCIRDTPKYSNDINGPRKIGQPGVPWSDTWYYWQGPSDSNLTKCRDHALHNNCPAIADGKWPSPTIKIEDRRLFELKDIRREMNRADSPAAQGGDGGNASGSVAGGAAAGLVSGQDVGPPPPTVPLWSRVQSRRSFYRLHWGEPRHTGPGGPLFWEMQLYRQQKAARKRSEDTTIPPVMV